jgi:hypothetical protein
MKIHEQITVRNWSRTPVSIKAPAQDVIGWLLLCYPEPEAFEAACKQFCSVIDRPILGPWSHATERTFEEVKAAFVKADL